MKFLDKAMHVAVGFLLRRVLGEEGIDAVCSLVVDMKFEGVKNDFFRIGKNSMIDFPWNCLEGLSNVSIGDNFRANKGLFLGAYGSRRDEAQIVIGNNVTINYDSQITAINRIVIGDDVLTGSRILISDHSHGEIAAKALAEPPLGRPLFSKGPVIIGDRVWIGSGVAIMPGVSIGEDSIIGANSVVTKSFPPRSVVAGNPARLIRTL